MTIILCLNLPLNIILQKTTKRNLPQSFPKSFPTFSYNILLHSLTKVYLCPFLYSHTQYSLSIYNLYTHTYKPCVHTLDFKIHTLLSQPFLLYTHQPTHHILPYPTHIFSYTISYTLTYSITHFTSHPSIPLQYISTIHPLSSLFLHMFLIFTIHFKPKPSQPFIYHFPPSKGIYLWNIPWHILFSLMPCEE